LGPEVVGVGEILIDFVSTEPVSYVEASTFQKCFGGAPMNTLVGVSRLGVSSGAITAVGGDPFGRFLILELERNGVDTSQVKVKRKARTTITFVANEPGTGERTFLFYREPWISGTADSLLEPDDIDYNYIAGARILHISGFALSRNPSRKAVFRAVEYAREAGVRISFDPTLRTDVWSSTRTLRRTYLRILRLSDVATFSREEAEFILGTADPELAARKALSYGVDLVGVKLGSEGSMLMTGDGVKLYAPAFKVRAVDTTGAGDGWNAGLLVGLCRGWNLEDCIKVANAVGALVVTRRGAITALPYREELNRFLEEHGVDFKV